MPCLVAAKALEGSGRRRRKKQNEREREREKTVCWGSRAVSLVSPCVCACVCVVHARTRRKRRDLGLALGGFMPAAFALLIESVDASRKSAAALSWSVGYVGGVALLAAGHSAVENWRDEALLAGFFVLCSAIVCQLLVQESPSWLLSAGRERDALAAAREIADLNGVDLNKALSSSQQLAVLTTTTTTTTTRAQTHNTRITQTVLKIYKTHTRNQSLKRCHTVDGSPCIYQASRWLFMVSSKPHMRGIPGRKKAHFSKKRVFAGQDAEITTRRILPRAPRTRRAARREQLSRLGEASAAQSPS